jgi:hypothetical protein
MLNGAGAGFEFMVPESKLEKTERAVCVVADDFEGERQLEQLGVNPFVLRPGEPMAMCHW